MRYGFQRLATASTTRRMRYTIPRELSWQEMKAAREVCKEGCIALAPHLDSADIKGGVCVCKDESAADKEPSTSPTAWVTSTTPGLSSEMVGT